ncbi:GntR family transcriptional regulator [Microbacterium terricola]|uniref:GntR family transcriptional regulator n=1 Tax=Microbacterium terricola TaxID=344163 RepID=A0ABM8DVK1_9MICO|nr:GntR family transcriptional regulator [Microbacterium terricola]UYK39661.1 GntR family transcriptional regulator [Microbacterium terricola]BDV29597.1 GntR family transcriptional regulator [Microbacterium terricola]
MSLHEALPQVARAGSLSEQVYRSVRASIADGRLEPGSRVTERQLAAALDVSPTPVREALGKLEHEGLVERVGARRLRIADHPTETLRELMEVEIMLRGAEARFAARKITPEAIERMRGYIDELVAARASLTLAEQFEMAQRFDAEIAQAAANTALRSLIDSYAIYGADHRLSRAAEDAKDPSWIERRIADHRAILDALAAGDEDAAERTMRGHARSAIQSL